MMMILAAIAEPQIVTDKRMKLPAIKPVIRKTNRV
jgi:hypothetical protein